jgi:hypothetical protein
MRAERRRVRAPWERGLSRVKVVLKTLSRQMSMMSSWGEKVIGCSMVNLHPLYGAGMRGASIKGEKVKFYDKIL